GGPIQVMLDEHDDMGDLLRKARQLTDDYVVPAEACGSWRALWLGLQALEEELHAHIHLENNVLFPRALACRRRSRGGCLARRQLDDELGALSDVALHADRAPVRPDELARQVQGDPEPGEVRGRHGLLELLEDPLVALGR